MTTIAYRDGIMAADDSCWACDTRTYNVKKLYRLKEGSLLGISGNLAAATRLIAFLQSDESKPPPRLAGASAILVRQNGRIFKFEDGTAIPMLRTKYIAGGSGFMVALGAMHAGATAVEAIKAAIAHDNSTQGRVYSLKLRG